jgi:hypothetical protein
MGARDFRVLRHFFFFLRYGLRAVPETSLCGQTSILSVPTRCSASMALRWSTRHRHMPVTETALS